MARHYTIYLNRDRFPNRAGLQAAIKALGFKLTLEEDYVPFVSSGYLPCTLDGEDAGFTLRFHTVEGTSGYDVPPPCNGAATRASKPASSWLPLRWQMVSTPWCMMQTTMRPVPKRYWRRLKKSLPNLIDASSVRLRSV